MAQSEQTLRKLVQAAVSRLGARVFRVNTGRAWAGKARPDARGGVYIPEAYPIRMGLVEGGSDLIGYSPVVVTPDMVGRTLAVFTAVELKTGRVALTSEQAHFLAVVRQAGGVAGVARTVEEAEALVRQAGHPAATPPTHAPDTATRTVRRGTASRLGRS